MKAHNEIIRKLMAKECPIVFGKKALDEINAIPEVDDVDTYEGRICLADGTVIRFLYVEEDYGRR